MRSLLLSSTWQMTKEVIMPSAGSWLRNQAYSHTARVHWSMMPFHPKGLIPDTPKNRNYILDTSKSLALIPHRNIKNFLTDFLGSYQTWILWACKNGLLGCPGSQPANNGNFTSSFPHFPLHFFSYLIVLASTSRTMYIRDILPCF